MKKKSHSDPNIVAIQRIIRPKKYMTVSCLTTVTLICFVKNAYPSYNTFNGNLGLSINDIGLK